MKTSVGKLNKMRYKNYEKQNYSFGSGEIGCKALSFLGSMNVCCFCDNDVNKVGAKKCGK